MYDYSSTILNQATININTTKKPFTAADMNKKACLSKYVIYLLS